MNIFIDTEFTDLVDMDLISIGLVAEDGRSFYGERSDFNQALSSEFVREVVLPQLGKMPSAVYPRYVLRDVVRTWLYTFKSEQPVICYDYFGDYALLLELLEQDVPEWLKARNIRDRIDETKKEEYLRTHGLLAHHALNDARANQFAFGIFGCGSSSAAACAKSRRFAR
jgi:hypothetical protein